jgi:hypothetical protein
MPFRFPPLPLPMQTNLIRPERKGSGAWGIDPSCRSTRFIILVLDNFPGDSLSIGIDDHEINTCFQVFLALKFNAVTSLFGF